MDRFALFWIESRLFVLILRFCPFLVYAEKIVVPMSRIFASIQKLRLSPRHSDGPSHIEDFNLDFWIRNSGSKWTQNDAFVSAYGTTNTMNLLFVSHIAYEI